MLYIFKTTQRLHPMIESFVLVKSWNLEIYTKTMWNSGII